MSDYPHIKALFLAHGYKKCCSVFAAEIPFVFLEAPKMADKPKRELPSQLKQLLALDVKLSKEVMEAVNRLAKNVISQVVDILLDGRCV